MCNFSQSLLQLSNVLFFALKCEISIWTSAPCHQVLALVLNSGKFCQWVSLKRKPPKSNKNKIPEPIAQNTFSLPCDIWIINTWNRFCEVVPPRQVISSPMSRIFLNPGETGPTDYERTLAHVFQSAGKSDYQSIKKKQKPKHLRLCDISLGNSINIMRIVMRTNCMFRVHTNSMVRKFSASNSRCKGRIFQRVLWATIDSSVQEIRRFIHVLKKKESIIPSKE